MTPADIPPPSLDAPRRSWRAGDFHPGTRVLAEETAIAITYNRITHAVMMATPADLEDFAVGFSLSEGIVPDPSCIEEIEIVAAAREGANGDTSGSETGIELRMWIAADLMHTLEQRRRRLAGATGCGMCGLESLGEALRTVPDAPRGRSFPAAMVQRACAELRPAQTLGDATRAVHAAAFWTPDPPPGSPNLLAVREDVGRHNALDKLAGALARLNPETALARLSPGTALPRHHSSNAFTENTLAVEHGIVLLTSRISIELVQKAARLGASVLAAVSAPTALAVRAADASGLTLIGIARDDGFEVFTHDWRVT